MPISTSVLLVVPGSILVDDVGSGCVGFGGCGAELEEVKTPSSPNITRISIKTATKMMIAHINFFDSIKGKLTKT